MLEVDFSSPVPVYDQIKAGLRGLVAKGQLRPGDEAPSIRGLAAALKVNPNTVARAFRELASEGFLDARRGGSSLIAEQAPDLAKGGLGGVRQSFQDAARRARSAGLGWEELLSAVRTLMKEDA
ncbi:MAG: GntR family transcriptional regulator [Elusimicrobia bacterium]|nr:GntR family transcriptional regulator [Elusimicrobiota bacterium]